MTEMTEELKERILCQMWYLVCMLDQHNLQPDDTKDAHSRAVKVYEELKGEWGTFSDD